MRESSTYMAILEEGEEIGRSKGRVEEARQLILRLGQKRFGPPSEDIKAKLAAITEDIERLERLIEQLLDASSWEELFAEE